MNFAPKYAYVPMSGHAGGITGYTTNQGAWEKSQIHVRRKGPFTKKRIKWNQADPLIYQITEHDEIHSPRSGIVPQLAMPVDRTVSQSVDATHQSDISGNKASEADNNTDPLTPLTLPPVNVNRGSARHRNRPKPRGLPLKHSYRTDWNANVARYLHSPKYTHLHVPKRTFLASSSSASDTSTKLQYHLPRIEPHGARKPVTVSLSQNARQSRMFGNHTRLNLRRLDGPFNSFTSFPGLNRCQTSESTEITSTFSKNVDKIQKDELGELRDQKIEQPQVEQIREVKTVRRKPSVFSEPSPLAKGSRLTQHVQPLETLSNFEQNIPLPSLDFKFKNRFIQKSQNYGQIADWVLLSQAKFNALNRSFISTTDVSPRKRWENPSYWPSQRHDSDGPMVSKTASRRRGVRTPRKSKRMAARLDGHSSTEMESSKSVSESTEHRPPLPQRKSDEKLNRKALAQKALEDNLKKNVPEPVSEAANTPAKSNRVGVAGAVEPDVEDSLDEALRASGNAPVQVGSSVSVTSSQDDTPMLQKLKDMNKKDQSSLRKKEIPRWLKGEDVSGPFENPPESRSSHRAEAKQPKSPQPEPTHDEINMLINEELSMFPEKKTEEPQPQPTTTDTADDGSTPMERIQKNRSKWRENPSLNLEESWGSLSQFNKQQRGRLSLDMDDDVLDEYINKIVGPAEPTIEEEPQKEAVGDIDIDTDDFVIPELPYGRELVVNILSTWGDKHYVGLTSIEVFTSTGEMATVSKIFADPEDINILPDYQKDPRVVKNLIDGVCRTRDDVHMWLAPFVQRQNHLVFITFDKPVKIALIRIWNYNKSRIHSYRGAKDVMLALDSNLIFTGEIARACGAIEGGTEAFGDTILFTTDEGILEAVSQHDEAFEGDMLDDDEPFDVERPATADDGATGNRPFTRAVGNISEREREATSLSLAREASMATFEGDILVYKGNCVELNFTATWGDHHYLGLTGLEVVGKDGEALPVTISMLTATPRDVTSLPGHEKDDRTLEKVIDGTNVSTSDEHMWLIPFTEGGNHTLQIDFGQKVVMAGLRIWNYNKSKEDTYRGARIVHVSINGKTISPSEGFLVRKGPGNCHFDFAQEISFSPDTKKGNNMASSVAPSNGSDDQNYEVVQMPCGFIYQLQLFSTWGDPYYVGLNGIEFYGADLKKIDMTESNISAYPDSVNVLEKTQGDARTPDKLIDGVNDTTDGGHMWLAPILPSLLNRVYVIFDQPTSVSMIKVWNYSKTCNRGTKDFALLVDDLLVYNGELQPVPQTARGILPNCEGPQPYHTILFTSNKDVQRKEKFTIINNQKGEQDVQMTNDKKVVSHYADPKKAHEGKPVDQTLRPTTSVIYSKSKKRR